MHITGSSTLLDFAQLFYMNPKQPSNDLGPGQYEAPSGIDELLNDKHKARHGEFKKVARFLRKPLERMYWMHPGDCPRDPVISFSSTATSHLTQEFLCFKSCVSL